MTNGRLLLILLGSTGFWLAIISANGEPSLAAAVALNWFFAGVVLLSWRHSIYSGIVATGIFLAVFVWPIVSDRLELAEQRKIVAALETRSEPVDLTGKTVLFLSDSTSSNGGCYSYCEALVMKGIPAATYLLALNATPQLLNAFEAGPVDLLEMPAHQVLMEDPSLPRAMRRGGPPTPEEAEMLVPWVANAEVDLSQSNIDYVVVAALTSRQTKNVLNAQLNAELSADDLAFMDAEYFVRVYAPENPRAFDINQDKPIYSLLTMDRKVLTIPYNMFGYFNWQWEHQKRSQEYFAYQHFQTGRFLCSLPEATPGRSCFEDRFFTGRRAQSDAGLSIERYEDVK